MYIPIRRLKRKGEQRAFFFLNLKDSIFGYCHEASPQPALNKLRLNKQTDLSCSSHSALQTIHHLCSSPLDALSQFYVLLLLWHPALEVRPHNTEQSRQPIPSPPGSAGPGAPQVWLVLWAARAHCWLMFYLLSARAPRTPFH